MPSNHLDRQSSIMVGNVQLYVYGAWELDSPWYQIAPYMVILRKGWIIALYNTEWSEGPENFSSSGDKYLNSKYIINKYTNQYYQGWIQDFLRGEEGGRYLRVAVSMRQPKERLETKAPQRRNNYYHEASVQQVCLHFCHNIHNLFHIFLVLLLQKPPNLSHPLIHPI